MKQDATPAQLYAWNFAGRAPVEQRAAADWQPRQQLLLVNEANLACGCLVLIGADAYVLHIRTDRWLDARNLFLLTIHNLLFGPFRREFTPARASAGVS